MEKKIIHIIPHTHWDREWYVPFQTFRFRLVKAIDKLLEMTDKDPDYHFNLDGQTIVLEDYLEIKPEMKERLRNKIKNGQIGIGPWYVQSSPWLQTGEGLVQNLKFGIDMCKEYDTKPVDNSYVPDQFIHPHQMPQILKGVGINHYSFSRGIGNHEDEFGIGAEFMWKGMDGSELLAVHLRAGYGTCANLSENPDIAMNTCVMDISSISEMKWATNLRVGFAGSDHSEPQDVFKEVMEIFNDDEELTEEFGQLIFSSWEKYFSELKTSLQKDNICLKTFQGEILGKKYIVSLHGIFSSRIDIKVRSFYLHNFLNYYSEPSAVINYVLGELSSPSKMVNENNKHRPFGVLTEYPDGYLATAWKYLLKNQAHDSSWCAAMDQVLEDMKYRFDQCELIGDEVFRRSAQLIVHNIKIPDSLANKTINAVVIFNPLPFKRSGFVSIRIENKQKDKRPILRDSEGKLVPSKFQSVDSGDRDRWNRRIYVPSHGSLAQNIYILEFKPKSVPGLGYSAYFVEYIDKNQDLDEEFESVQESFVDSAPNSMENDAVVVTFNNNGSFNVFDKETKKKSEEVHIFEDVSDIGDGWEFKSLDNDVPIRSDSTQAEIMVHDANDGFTCFKVEIKMRLPECLDVENDKRSENMEEFTICSYITLRSGFSRMVEIRTEIKNNIKDHRLRVLFPSKTSAKNSVAAGLFGLTERPIAPPDSSKWRFSPDTYYPHHYFFHIYDAENKQGTAVLTKGIFEYEIYDKNEQGIQTSALTLLRANQRWGRHLGIGKRPNNPSAQMLNLPLVLDYGFVFLADEQPGFEFGLYQMSMDFNLPFRAEENFDTFRLGINAKDGILPSKFGFCAIEGEGIVYSACYKPKGVKGIVIRVYNISNKPQKASITLGHLFEKVKFVNLLDEPVTLDEQIMFEIGSDNNTTKASFTALPLKIYSLLFE